MLVKSFVEIIIAINLLPKVVFL